MALIDPMRAADLLIRQHGMHAGDRAAERWRQLVARGDQLGAAGWMQIIDAIREVERTELLPGEFLH